jgi:mono/diheme cytochrome c family protein
MAHPLIEFAGRLHPVILHLPIGLLAGLALLEGLALARRRRLDPAVRTPLALAAAASALAAAGSGWLLADATGYAGRTLDLHRWLALATAALTTFAAASLLMPRAARLYPLTLALALATLAPAGHFGGSLTHGEDFLFAPFRTPTPAPVPEPSTRYQGEIRPLLQTYCVDCHNPTKRKGGLDLSTLEGLHAGGESGPAAVAHDLESSEVVYRMRLTPGAKGRMPPRDKPQPTDDELAALADWIAAGMP